MLITALSFACGKERPKTVPRSFTFGFKPMCFTNPSHHRLSSLLRRTPQTDHIFSATLVSVFGSYFFCFWFRAVDEAVRFWAHLISSHRIIYHDLSTKCSGIFKMVNKDKITTTNK